MNREVAGFFLIAFALGAVGIHAANRNVTPNTRRQRWIKFTTYFLLMSGVLVLAGLGRGFFTVFVVSVAAIGTWELYSVLGTAIPATRQFRAAILTGYALLAGGLILFSRLAAPEGVMFVYLMVAVFDGFSQVFGQLLGRNPLAPAISPSKTIEGSMGGALAAGVAAMVLRRLIDASPSRALTGCGMIVAVALAGDLTASWVKRRCGVKDFGHLLPGHGGVLDRFDEFPVFAAPVIAPAASTLPTQGTVYELGQAKTGDHRIHRPSGTESPVRDPSELPAAAAPAGDLCLWPQGHERLAHSGSPSPYPP